MWTKYNPDWLVNLLQQQLPDKTELADAVKNCRRGVWQNKGYIYFVSPKNPDLPGSEWQFKENVIVEDEARGAVVIDILQDGRVGGLQFLDLGE
jgi:hypothetical protein